MELLKDGVREFNKQYPELYEEGEELLKRLREYREKVTPILN